MKIFNWNEEKNQQLKEERGIGFEDVVSQIQENGLLDIIYHLNQTKYPNQKIYIIELFGYICMVPFVINDDEIFLKTIIPSRKMNRIYKEQK